MREVQLYVEDKRLDIFDGVDIQINSSIQDAKDISKVFTDFSVRFDVPASSANNQIFKHFYNFNITTGRFDARVRHEAKIFLNHLLFKKGRLFLNSIDMKNGKANKYNLTFFGNTVSLVDTFGEDTLAELYNYDGHTKGLEIFDHDFTYTNVKSIFEGDGYAGSPTTGDSSALIYPLITSKKRLFYNSSLVNTDPTNFDGNVYIPSSGYDIDQYHKRGVKPVDLKPAIKCYHIIKAIEEKYNLNFIPNDTSGTKDFFSKHNEAFSNLYMWMSNGSGNIDGEIGDDQYIYHQKLTWSDYGDDTPNGLPRFSVSGEDMTVGENFILTPVGENEFEDEVREKRVFVEVFPDSSYTSIPYRLKVTCKTDGSTQTFEGSGNRNLDGDGEHNTAFDIKIYGKGTHKYFFEFFSETPMEDTEIRLHHRLEVGQIGNKYNFDSYTTGASVDTNQAEIVSKNHIPDMKVIDFMTGLFKMFNLTAYYIDDENDPEYDADTPVVKVTTLDNFYADAVNNQSKGIIDITKYIDKSQHNVATSLPFSEIDMRFEKTDSVLMENHIQIADGEIFGNSHLPISRIYPDFFFGDKYDIKLPFSKLKYERIKGTDIQWGYAAGGDFNAEDSDYSDANDIKPPKGNYNSINIKPLLFYGVRMTNISQNINFSDDSSTTADTVDDYYRPSNTNETATLETQSDFNINFDSEADEWTGVEYVDSNSLFFVFYKSYIESVFNIDKRIFTFIANFPPSFLIHYKLNDQLKIQDTVYRINSIKTNIVTGKSKLELINLSPTEIIE